MSGVKLALSMNCGSDRCFAAVVTDSDLMIGRACTEKAKGRLRCHSGAITIARQDIDSCNAAKGLFPTHDRQIVDTGQSNGSPSDLLGLTEAASVIEE